MPDFASIRRVLDYTKSEEFQKANLYTLQARLELLELRWKDFETEYHQWRLYNEQNVQADSKVGEEMYIEAKAVLYISKLMS